jgi:6-methylsalicylate decarboxylase
MRIDTHFHFAPRDYHRALQRHPVGPTVPAWTLADSERAMERYQVDIGILSAAAGVYFGDQTEANELARMVNEAAAELVAESPTRFGALASIPLPDTDAAFAELEYALDVLALDGVILLSQVGGTYIGEQAFWPLLEELDKRAAYVLVHPATPPWTPSYTYPLWIGELPFESTRAVISLLYSGALERFPNIKFQLSHLGGAVPFLAHRIGSYAERDLSQREHVPAGALTYLRRFFLDTALATNGPALAATLWITTVEKLVFGSDWPYLPDESIDLEVAWPGMERADLDRVEHGNALTLIPRLATQAGA